MDVWSPGGGIDRVLVVTAHPDDVDFGAAGTVAAMTDAGVAVTYCVVTDGQAGGSDRSMDRATMADIRRREQRAAAATVGVDDVTFLGYPDGSLFVSLDLRRDISRVIRQVRPDLVITQSPERSWNRLFASHPDHLAAGEAAVCAVYPDARNPFAHPELLKEGLEPHAVGSLWLMAFDTPTIAVATTATIDRKVAALRCHQSQVGDGAAAVEERIREWGAQQAQAAGLPEGAFAEAFLAVRTG
jgi:LmbE family N-acetylglucosaminyl deacetylase